MGCTSCDGVLISLLYYRDWAGRLSDLDEIEPIDSNIIEENDSKIALSCPKCLKLMTKYLISGSQSNRLDVCPSCDEAWIDNGEWALLKTLNLAKRLPLIFTLPWQSRIRKEINEKNRYERLEKIVGNEDAERAREIREWLNANRNKSAIIHYIGFE